MESWKDLVGQKIDDHKDPALATPGNGLTTKTAPTLMPGGLGFWSAVAGRFLANTPAVPCGCLFLSPPGSVSQGGCWHRRSRALLPPAGCRQEAVPAVHRRPPGGRANRLSSTPSRASAWHTGGLPSPVRPLQTRPLPRLKTQSGPADREEAGPGTGPSVVCASDTRWDLMPPDCSEWAS